VIELNKQQNFMAPNSEEDTNTINAINASMENALLTHETTAGIQQLHVAHQPEGTRKAYSKKVDLYKVKHL
jgi:hypothetical protein